MSGFSRRTPSLASDRPSLPRPAGPATGLLCLAVVAILACQHAEARGRKPTRISGLAPGAAGCQPLELKKGVDVGGYKSERFSWWDEGCQNRSAALVRNDRADPGGTYGGFLRELVWFDEKGKKRETRGTGVNRWNGWGYIVNHYADKADHSGRHPGTHRVVLAGRHHAIHEFKVQMMPGGPVDATVHWFFATGRSNPVYAITFDASRAGPNRVKADTRAPYGDFAFDGKPQGHIGGIEWGDQYRFTTRGSGPVSMSSSWDYRVPNRVPYVRMWSSDVDAEMGAVQTLPFDPQPAGGDYGNGLLSQACWRRSSETKEEGCSQSGETMPANWLWPFQLNQYELGSTRSSHRLAWGSTYGTVGQTEVTAFGRKLSGYPMMSYAVHVVIGQRSREATRRQVRDVERTAGATIEVSVGTLRAEGPGGAGRADVVTRVKPGYDPAYGTWEVELDKGKASVELRPADGPLRSPVFRFYGFNGPALRKVVINGVEARDGRDFFSTVDPASRQVWLTLNGEVTAPVKIDLQ